MLLTAQSCERPGPARSLFLEELEIPRLFPTEHNEASDSLGIQLECLAPLARTIDQEERAIKRGPQRFTLHFLGVDGPKETYRDGG